jgi:signal transduction histidine kinase
MKDGKTKNYTLDRSGENGVTSIAISKTGQVWVGAFGGLGLYRPQSDDFKWFNRSDGLPSPYVNQLDVDNNNVLWFATNGGGVGRYDGQSFRAYSVEEGLTSRNALSIRFVPFNNRVYVGTDNGVNVINNHVISSLYIKELENTSVHSISLFREKSLLIGSGGSGVVIYNLQTQSERVLDTSNGLPSDFIYFVGADREGLIWVGTEKGITKVKLNAEWQVEEMLHYGFDNGLAGVETNVNAYYLGDEKYFGLIDGVYQYNDLRKEGFNSFPLHLTDVEIFNGQFASREFSKSQQGFFKVPVNLNLPSDKNHITFRFNRVDKRYPKSVQYQYFLSGWDKTWSIPSTTNYVTYSNLPPGDYEFQAKATDNKGSWDREPLRYSFTIKAPFYQTAAFQITAAVTMAGLLGLYSFYRVRSRFNKIVELQQIRQQEQDSLRKEIARDFHDEMGNQLTRIINYISLIKLNGHTRENGHSDNALDLYNKVEESAKYLYAGTRDFIWSIDPVNDELYKLFIHIRDFGDKLFSEKDINFRAYNEVKEKKVTVPYGFSREANLIFKEAMTNSFNHSSAKNVSFTLRQDGERFEMVLEDDGKGFNLSQIDRLNGIKNMRNRAERIQAVLQVKSSPGQGTLIGLGFTINKKKIISYELPL